MKKLTSMMACLAIGAASMAHAGYLVTARVSYSLYPSTGGTNPGTVSLSSYIPEMVNYCGAALTGAGHKSSLNSGYQTETYQLYYRATAPGDSPPSTVYCHMLLNGACHAQLTATSVRLSGGTAYVIPTTSGYGSHLAGCSAVLPSQTYGYTPGNNTEVDSIACTWTIAYYIGIYPVYKTTNLITVTSFTVQNALQLWTTDPYAVLQATAVGAMSIHFELIP